MVQVVHCPRSVLSGGATACGDGTSSLIGRYSKYCVVLLGKMSDYCSYLQAFIARVHCAGASAGRRLPLESTV